MTDEGACQMALISEACCECGLSWSVICSEEPPREQNTTLNQVGVRRRSCFAGEAAQKLEATCSGELGEFSKRDRRMRLCVETLSHSADRWGEAI